MEKFFLAPPTEGQSEEVPAPSFSVAVAAYQAAAVIGEAIQSVLQQTVRPLEIIVCDDGSTDDLEGAIAPFRAEITLLKKAHGGEGSAKNAAIAAAKGDFVAILDADDVYLPRRLEALTQLARLRPDLDILTSDAYLVVGDRRVRCFYDRRWPFELFDQRRAILQRNFIFGHAAVRRERFLRHGGFDESILWTTDWDLWLRLILDGSRAGTLREPLALYRVRESSLTSRRRELLLGKIATLEKAARNQQLASTERPVLTDSLAAHRRQLTLLDLRAGIADEEAGARTRAWRILVGPGFTLQNRLEAAAVVALPGVCRSFLRRRAAATWVGAGGTRVRRARRPRMHRLLSRARGARLK